MAAQNDATYLRFAAQRLHEMLHEESVHPPVAVRIQAAERVYHLFVEDALIQEEYFSLSVTDHGGRFSLALSWTDVVCIDAFKDARGRPVFLRDFDHEAGFAFVKEDREEALIQFEEAQEIISNIAADYDR
jgi:hypothetical protein